MSTRPRPDNTRIIYTFNFFDTQSQIKQFPAVEAKASLQFFARLDSAGPYGEKQFPSVHPKSCEIGYFDKYGAQQPLILDISDYQNKGLEDMLSTDTLATQRDRLCDRSIRAFGIAEDIVADCVNGTHVSTIEPSYLWQRAVNRALISAAAYSRRIHPASPPRPGVILICNHQASDCDADAAEFRSTVESLGISLTAWLCPSDADSLGKCQQSDFLAR